MSEVVNFLIDNLVAIFEILFGWLPNSPFQNINTTLNDHWLGIINYFFPVQEAVTHLTLYIGAVLVWYSIRIIARWTKAASD